MRLSHISLFAALGSALLFASARIERIVAVTVRALERFALLVIDTLARPVSMLAGASFAFAGGAPSTYDGPPIHSLRHEAGTSRRAAARNT